MSISSYSTLNEFSVLATTGTGNGEINSNGYIGSYPETYYSSASTEQIMLAQEQLIDLLTEINNITSTLRKSTLFTYNGDNIISVQENILYTLDSDTINVHYNFRGDSESKFYIQCKGNSLLFSYKSIVTMDKNINPDNIFWLIDKSLTISLDNNYDTLPGVFITGITNGIDIGTTVMKGQIEGRIYAKNGYVMFFPETSITSPIGRGGVGGGGGGGGVGGVGGGGVGTVCYAKGTLILTKHGYVPIEKIKAGHQVVTKGKIHDNSYIKNVKETIEPVLWISKFKLKHLNTKTRPICIQKNAFGNIPFQDLYVSPDHSLLINGKMVKAKKIVNGTTIYQPECSEVVYYHVEFEDHNSIIANGILAESYLEMNNRHVFEHSVKYRKKQLHKLIFHS